MTTASRSLKYVTNYPRMAVVKVTINFYRLDEAYIKITFGVIVIIATGNQLDGLSLLEACQM